MAAASDVYHSAALFLELHGDDAIAEARKLSAEMRAKGRYRQRRHVAADYHRH